MKIQPSPEGGNGGFSVLEVLVSLAMLGLLLLTINTALRFSRRSVQLASSVDLAMEQDATLSAVVRRLEQIMPMYEREADGRPRVSFRGKQDRVEFVAASPMGRVSPGGLYRYEISAASDAAGRSKLLLRWTRYQPLSADAEPQTRVLIDDIAGFGLRYFGSEKPDASPGWESQWSRRDLLPDLIELRVARRQFNDPPITLQVPLQLRSQRQ